MNNNTLPFKISNLLAAKQPADTPDIKEERLHIQPRSLNNNYKGENTIKNQSDINPRFIRVKDIPRYLGINIHYFNRHIRPDLPYIQYGKQSICFDRLDLDQWMINNKRCNGMSRNSK